MALVASSTRRCCGSPPPPRWSLCWRVRCTDCGEWVTKHDFSKEDALSIAGSHVCPRLSERGSAPTEGEEP